MTKEVSVDIGNGDVKVFGGRHYTHFRSAIAPLSASDWARVTNNGRNSPPAGYIAVNGAYFAVGDRARRYALRTPPRGAQRYERDYYGVLMAAALVEVLEKSERVVLYATHAPADFDYAIDLENAARGRWEIISRKGAMNVNVVDVQTVDEPLAGVYHYAITPQYAHRKNLALPRQVFAVLDIGAHTADFGIFDPGYELDQRSIGSTRFGIANVLEAFEKDVRSAFRTQFKNTMDIDPTRIHHGLLEGRMPFGNTFIDVSALAREHMTELANDCISLLQAKTGGLDNVNCVLITGGGGGLIKPWLEAALPSVEFIAVDDDPAKIRYANALGAYKFFKMLERRNAQGGK